MQPISPLIRDIQEHKPSTREDSAQADPAYSTPFGFPPPRKRWKKAPSQSPGQLQSQAWSSSNSDDRGTYHETSSCSVGTSSVMLESLEFWKLEKARIDMENRQRITDMSQHEVISEREKLLRELDPSTIRRLLARASIKDGGENDGGEWLPSDKNVESNSVARLSPMIETPATKSFDEKSPNAPPKCAINLKMSSQPSQTCMEGASTDKCHVTHDAHFPAIPILPENDITHPDFLHALHSKYFPNLPVDPSKLAWMAPLPTEDSAADKDSPYHPGRPTIAISALRFNFRGALIPPSLARAIPVSLGLHHHGEAPEAAGYTVRELSLLARSAVPAQRCIAFQTLGRILFRLGQGEWGTSSNSELSAGIWAEMKLGHVLVTLSDASAMEYGHRGSKAFATEALWLFEKSGWKSQLTGR